jgi:hypothetical protein
MIRGLLLSAVLLVLAQVQDTGFIAARFSASNRNPLVGEPVQMTIEVTLPPGTTILAWPDFPEQWGRFEVRQVDEIEITENADGTLEYRQGILVVVWESGGYQTPETVLVYQAAAETLELVIEPLQLVAVSVLKPDDMALRPMKPPVYLTYVPPVLITGIAAVLGLTVWWWFYRSRRFFAVDRSTNGVRQLDSATLAALKAIERQSLKPGEIYDAAEEQLRAYLAHQFALPAQEMTSSELLNQLQTHLSPPHLNRLHQLLGQADLVKFAREEPDRPSAHRYVEMAARWIQATAKDTARYNGHEGR